MLSPMPPTSVGMSKLRLTNRVSNAESQFPSRNWSSLTSTKRLSQYPHSTQPLSVGIWYQTRGCPSAPPPWQETREDLTYSTSGGSAVMVATLTFQSGQKTRSSPCFRLPALCASESASRQLQRHAPFRLARSFFRAVGLPGHACADGEPLDGRWHPHWKSAGTHRRRSPEQPLTPAPPPRPHGQNPRFPRTTPGPRSGSKFTYGPFGITMTCAGACGAMSENARLWSVSSTLLQGISPRRIFAKMFWSSYE